MIAGLLANIPGLQKRGFWRTVIALAEEPQIDVELRKREFLPDAFRIDRESCVIEIHEAVNTHPPKRRALMAMGMLWYDFDSGGWGEEQWDVKLFLHRNDTLTPAEVDLGFWWMENVRETAKAVSIGDESPVTEGHAP